MNTEKNPDTYLNPSKKDTERIVILDFGGQYAHLIANKIRRIGVHSVIVPHDIKASKLNDCSGIILSGGPQSVNDTGALLADPNIFDLGIPILGICYGHQLTNKILGGSVSPGRIKEYGKSKLLIDKHKGLFKDIEQNELKVWMSHWDEVTDIPVDFEVLAHTEINDFAAVGNLKKHIYGIQFHPEVTHTQQGMQIIKNFVEITGAKKTWNTCSHLKKISKDILKKIKSPQTLESRRHSAKKVFMLVSGGVDSMVAFTILNQVLGKDQVYGMLIDTGFMRQGEIQEVQEALDQLGLNNLHIDNAKEDFFQSLKGISDPEEKRKIIGKKFIERQRKAIQDLNLTPENWILGQGTIYPDTIESGGTQNSEKIKTHHNRVPEIEALERKGLIIEPLRDLYKDEVRQLGEMIGLPHHLVWRHPFPGPGLAIRILCTPREIPVEENSKLQEEKINRFLDKYDLAGKILPIQSVGVQGDIRTYRHPLVIFPIEGKGWQDHWEKHELQEISSELTNRFDKINRVLFSLSNSPINSAGIIPNLQLTPSRVRQLQKADLIVMNEISKYDSEKKTIWQCPTVLIPIRINQNNQEHKYPDAQGIHNIPGECFVIRPISSIDAMTADFVLIPQKNLNNILDQFKNLQPSAVFYDLTNKPPGTIEWE